MTTNTSTIAAWLIHKSWSGDTSAKAYFFTEKLGLVSSLYKGGRTPKKQAMLQPFTSLSVTLNERHSMYFVQSVEWEACSLPLVGIRLFSAIYLNELLYYLLKPLAPEPELFKAYVVTLHQLALAEDNLTIEALLRRFEWTLITTYGQNFSLKYEAETNTLIKEDYYYQLVFGKGLVRMTKGIPGQHLLAIAADDLSTPAYLKSAKILMRQAIDNLLNGREIKARSLFVM